MVFAKTLAVEHADFAFQKTNFLHTRQIHVASQKIINAAPARQICSAHQSSDTRLIHQIFPAGSQSVERGLKIAGSFKKNHLPIESTIGTALLDARVDKP
jgi:hypothetical protein